MTDQADGGDVLLTVKEYATLFRKGVKALYRRLADPRRCQSFPFPVIRDGRSLLIMVPAQIVARLRRPPPPRA